MESFFPIPVLPNQFSLHILGDPQSTSIRSNLTYCDLATMQCNKRDRTYIAYRKQLEATTKSLKK